MGHNNQRTILLVDPDLNRATSTATAIRRSLTDVSIEIVASEAAALCRIGAWAGSRYACVILPDDASDVATQAPFRTSIRKRCGKVRIPVIEAPRFARSTTALISRLGSTDAGWLSGKSLVGRILQVIDQTRSQQPQDTTPPNPESLPPEQSRPPRQRGQITSRTAMAMLRAIFEKDAATGTHCMWVGWLAAEIGRTIGAGNTQIEQLRTAGVLHDLGKLSIPGYILQKPGPLTQAERNVVDRHVMIGADLVARYEMNPLIERAIRCHHDWFDGTRVLSGCPDRTRPVYGRILAVADAFQSMIEERPYRPRNSTRQALDELKRCSGTQFDPRLVDAMLNLMTDAERTASRHPVPSPIRSQVATTPPVGTA
ncbi:MAG: HD domain-containing protein [Phycisphaerae bacterium]|nr:HD domain-containing protein [Phycisphaerae bacterium]